jgi:hypothetical protein
MIAVPGGGSLRVASPFERALTLGGTLAADLLFGSFE